MEPKIRMKMLRNLSEKLGAKFPVTTFSYSMVRIAYLYDAFLDRIELEAMQAQMKVNHCSTKKRKGKKRKAKSKN